MANSAKDVKKTSTKKTSEKKKAVNKKAVKEVAVEQVVEQEIVEQEAVKEEVVKEETIKEEPIKEAKKYAPTDLIPCLNVFAGSTTLIGKKSKNVYTWEALGVSEDVEYQDIMSEILNKKSIYIYEPLLIVEDEEFLSQRPDLKEMYNGLHTPEELTHIIERGTPSEVRNTIKKLPKGIKESVKNIAITLIQEDRMDSIAKIKIIDELLGTELRKQLELFLG